MAAKHSDILHRDAMQLDEVPDAVLTRIRRKVEKYIARGWKIDIAMGRRIAAPDWNILQRDGPVGFDAGGLFKKAMTNTTKKGKG